MAFFKFLNSTGNRFVLVKLVPIEKSYLKIPAMRYSVHIRIDPLMTTSLQVRFPDIMSDGTHVGTKHVPCISKQQKCYELYTLFYKNDLSSVKKHTMNIPFGTLI